MKQLIAYRRVSTKKQEETGLGLAAQDKMIDVYRANPEYIVIGEYVEIESGRKCDRPQLAKAIEQARRTGATLIIAKLDRLARNVAFTSALLDSGVEFIACDMPNATRFTIHIYAAIAEEEARMIRERTKAALAIRKSQGKKLGSANPKIKAALAAATSHRHAAGITGRGTIAHLQRERYGAILPVIRSLHACGFSYAKIARSLTDQGYKTTRGSNFSRGQVMRVLRREAELNSELASLTS